MSLSSKVFFPILGTFWLSSGHLNDALECINSFAHLCVELLLNCVQMEVHVLTESDSKRQWLFNSTLQMQIGIKLYLKMVC